MTSNENNQNINPNDEISVKEVFSRISEIKHYIFSKWLVIFVAAILGAAIGLIYSFFARTTYKAELSFALEDERGGGGLSSALGLASQFGIDLGSDASGGSVFSGDNLLELMKSRSMVESALLSTVSINNKKETLAEFYIDFNHLRDYWQNNSQLRNIRFPPNADRSKFNLAQDSLLGTFYKSIEKSELTVEKIDKKLSIIKVTVNSENELFSKYFTEVLVKTVSDFYIETKTKKSVQNLTILQHQTDSVRRALNNAISGVASSTDYNPNPNPALQVLRVPSQRRQVDVQANQAILTQLIANLEISKVSVRKDTPLIQIIDKPILPLDKKKLGHIKALVVGAVIASILLVFGLLAKYLLKNLTK